MIRLSKSVEKKQLLSENDRRVAKTIALCVLWVCLFVGGTSGTIYFMAFHINEPARLIIRNIEQHPSQWEMHELENSQGMQFVNRSVGVYANVPFDTRFSSVMYFDEKYQKSAVTRISERKQIGNALNRFVKGQDLETIESAALSKLRKYQ